jgi:hypothetical protein
MSLKEDSAYKTTASPPDESNGRKRRLDSITNATLEESSASDDEPIVSLRKKANANKPANSVCVSQSASVKKQATKPDASTSTKKKRSRKTKKENDASVQRVQSLIQALPRKSLEELVLSSFQNSVISMEQIEDAFPPNDQWKKDAMNRKSPLKITKSHSRTNTGSFDIIDDEIMGMILMNLDVKTRVMMCNSICTGWRSFSESMPFLWNLTIDNVLSFPQYYYRYIDPQLIMKILRWIPKEIPLKSVVFTSNKDSGAKGRDITTCLLQNKHKLDELKRVDFNGPKLNTVFLKGFVKNFSSFLPNLQEFNVVNHGSNKEAMNVPFETLFERTPNLTKLTISPNVFDSDNSGRNCLTYIQALSRARNRQSTLLEYLDLKEQSFCSISLSQFSTIATLCPELETFKIRYFKGIPTSKFPPPGMSADDAKRILDADIHSNPFATIPALPVLSRLKTFSMEGIRAYSYVWDPHYTSTPVLQSFIEWLLQGMPNVAHLFLRMGMAEKYANKKSNCVVPELPCLGNSLRYIPETLKSFILQDVNLGLCELEFLLRCNDLEFVFLGNVGINMIDALGSLRQEFPQYTLECKERDYSPHLLQPTATGTNYDELRFYKNIKSLESTNKHYGRPSTSVSCTKYMFRNLDSGKEKSMWKNLTNKKK